MSHVAGDVSQAQTVGTELCRERRRRSDHLCPGRNVHKGGGLIAGGSWQSFWAEAESAAPGAVWRCWTDLSTWGDWDRGLTSASLDGAFMVGAVGELVDISGRRSRFEVQQV